jgi:hypothetical protein
MSSDVVPLLLWRATNQQTKRRSFLVQVSIGLMIVGVALPVQAAGQWGLGSASSPLALRL